MWATWEEGAAVWAVYRGHAQRTDGIGGIHGLQVALHGDTAYGTNGQVGR